MIMRLKEARTSVGLEQKAVAADMGVTPSCICNWELEVALPKTRDLPRLARVLGCSIDDLFIPEPAGGDTAMLMEGA